MEADNLRDNEKLLKIQRSQSNPLGMTLLLQIISKNLETFDIACNFICVRIRYVRIE